MLRHKALSCLALFSALVSTACAAGVPTPAPSFTISASNVTMPQSGLVQIPFTLTSVNGFVGSVGISCTGPTVSAGVKAPYCENYGPVQAYPLTANGTATGTYNVVAKTPPLVPAAKAANSWTQGHGGAWALAGVGMLGLGLRRRRRRFAGLLVAIGALGVMAMNLSGCGGPPTLTPGAYVFTLTAQSVSNGTLIPVIAASTTATVTVPAGIVTDASNGK